MRLLKRSPDTGIISLTSFDDDDPPPYAILSHTWTEGKEVTYTELTNGTGTEKTGYDKIRFCVDQAAQDGIEYSWLDTCCIDKSVNDELSTAINSMFRWYHRAVKCYVYLADVEVPDECIDAQNYQITWDESFRRSRWFKRGWTLQELLAPATVEFFSKNQRQLGSKISLEQTIHEITSIPIEALRHPLLSEFSVEERMRWTEGRTTTRKEDKAYCLLGIFGVFLPLIYGEGEKHALQRLQERVAQQGERNVQDISVSSSLPFPKNILFTGREDQLTMLRQSLLNYPGHQRMSLFGLGGCGKSAVALEFAYRAMAIGQMVFWIPATSHQSFELAFRRIGMDLHVPGIADDNADVLKLVQQSLSRPQVQAWLMIVDNADDPDILLQRVDGRPEALRLIDFLPHSTKGKILFTMRSRKVAESLTPSNILELKSLDLVEAKQILARHMTKKVLLIDDKAVTELLEVLTCLPLAIVQASAFINNNDVPICEYVSMLQDTGREAEVFSEHFDDQTRYPEMDSTIAKTWYISFQQIRRHDPLAAEYLSFMACIDRINIPQSLLPEAGSRFQFIKAIGTLKAYSLITERQHFLQQTENEKFFDMHRLVHMTSTWWLKEQNEWMATNATVAARLENLIPYEGHEWRAVWVAYLPHAIHITKDRGALDQVTRASLLDRVGRCQYSLGQFATAALTYRQIIELREPMLGADHPDTLASMNGLALLLDHLGKYEEAEVMHRRTLAQTEAVLGPEHPNTLSSMNNLAQALEHLGKYKDAEAIHRQILAQKEILLGADHPDTLLSLNNLAQSLEHLGKYEEAEAIYRQTLAQKEILLGADHPRTLLSMNNLALVLHHSGKYEEAEAMHRRTLVQTEVVLGPEHPNTLSSMNNLALALEHLGKNEEAEAIFRQTLAQREAVLGEDHPDTLVSVYCIAHLQATLQRYDESETAYERALAGFVSVLGENHPMTLDCRANYALLARHGMQPSWKTSYGTTYRM